MKSMLRFSNWLCLLMLIATATVAQQSKPNVIFILADDMGYADLSCYGNPLIKTPHLDKLAATGFKGTSFMVPSPACTPSRAALLTGRYPDHVGLGGVIGPGSHAGLADSIFTLAKLFKQQHYQTMIVGKWHLGDQPHTKPLDHGFDHFYGMHYSHDYQAPFVQTDTTLAVFYDNKRVIERPDYSQLLDWYTDTAMAYISRSAKAHAPFFLYLPFPMPHAPLAVPASWKGHSQAGLYGDVIEELDDCVGRITALLQQLKIDKNTLIVFTSDNGPWNDMPDRMFGRDIVHPWDHGSTGPFRGGKANSYEGGHREPFIAWWPGRIPAGQTSAVPFVINDMLPTLATAIGSKQSLPGNLEGIDMWQLLTGKNTTASDRPLYYLNNGQLEAVRMGDWKLRIAKAGQSPETELYNLVLDPSEKHNMADKYPDQVRSLKALLDSYPVL